MSTLTIDSIASRQPTAFDPAHKGTLGLALETAGQIVLNRPWLVCLVVLPLALMLGSLVGISLDGIGHEPPPPLFRLATP